MTELEKILGMKKISKLKLALECKITPADLYSAINGKKVFYPKWRYKVSNYLNVDESLNFDGEKLKEDLKYEKDFRNNNDICQ